MSRAPTATAFLFFVEGPAMVLPARVFVFSAGAALVGVRALAGGGRRRLPWFRQACSWQPQARCARSSWRAAGEGGPDESGKE